MCDNGSTDKAMSDDEIGNPPVIDRTFDMKFAWVSITPFGSPVVPDLYIIVARSSGLIALRYAPKAAGLLMERCAPFSKPAAFGAYLKAIRPDDLATII